MDLRFFSCSTWLYQGGPGPPALLFGTINIEMLTPMTPRCVAEAGWDAMPGHVWHAPLIGGRRNLRVPLCTVKRKRAANSYPAAERRDRTFHKIRNGGLHPNFLGAAFVQSVRYFVPALGGPQRDVAAGLGFTTLPEDVGDKSPVGSFTD